MFKNLDKKTIVILVICIALLLSWTTLFSPDKLNLLGLAKPQKTSEVQNTTKVTTEKKAVSESVTTPTKVLKSVETKIDTSKLGSISELESKFPAITLDSKSSKIQLTINPVKGQISSLKLKDFQVTNSDKDVTFNKNIVPGALSISEPAGKWKLVKVYQTEINPQKTVATVKRDFLTATGETVQVKQTWKIGDSYTSEYQLTLQNLSNKSITIPELDVWVGGMPPVKYLSGDNARSDTHGVDVYLANGKESLRVKADSDAFLKNPVQTQPITWIATYNKFFASMLKLSDTDGTIYGGNRNKKINVVYQDKNGKQTNYPVVNSAARLLNIDLKPGVDKSWNFKYFAGPKDVQLLRNFSPSATDIMHLAWSILNTVSIWFLYALIYIKGVVGSYGWAIVVLTIIIRLIFWPITHKSTASMKRMQRLQPQIKELKKKYKDNKQVLNTKTMELYKKEKVNPLGGCLPILVQIPVLIALYWTLDGAVELRHAHFLWATDLTQPDTVAHIMGLPINPFAILMALTMLLQQKMTPTASMEPAQAKMMMLMPLIMLVFLYNLPSGLTLYWTVSQVISILQLLVTQHLDKKNNKKNLTTA